MKHLAVIQNGDEGLNAAALAYLLALGIPQNHIRRMVVDSEVGNVETITVTLYVHRDLGNG